MYSLADDKDFMGKGYHLECFFEEMEKGGLQEHSDSLNSIVDIKGYDSLEEEDQIKLKHQLQGFARSQGKGIEGIVGGKSGKEKSKGQQQKKQKQGERSEGLIADEQLLADRQDERELSSGGKERSSDLPDGNGKRKESTGHGKEVASPTHKKKKDVKA